MSSIEVTRVAPPVFDSFGLSIILSKNLSKTSEDGIFGDCIVGDGIFADGVFEDGIFGGQQIGNFNKILLRRMATSEDGNSGGQQIGNFSNI